jgi:hypothetical protein
MLWLILIILVGTQSAVLWLLWAQRPKPVPAAPGPPEVWAAMRQAFAECGLNVNLCVAEFDLLASGKLDDVIHHASTTLGRPIRTVHDVVTRL